MGLLLERAGTSAERGTPPVSFGSPPDVQLLIVRSEDGLSHAGDDDRVVALSVPDPEITAILFWAVENFGLMWNPPPDGFSVEWFLGGGSRFLG